MICAGTDRPANPLSLLLRPLPLNVCLMADNEVGLFAETTRARPLPDTHVDARARPHACTSRGEGKGGCAHKGEGLAVLQNAGPDINL